MAIAREQRRLPLGGGRVRYRTVVKDDPCQPRTQAAVARYRAFVQLLADQHHLTVCGHFTPDRLVVSHDGVGWVAVAEIEVDEPDQIEPRS